VIYLSSFNQCQYSTFIRSHVIPSSLSILSLVNQPVTIRCLNLIKEACGFSDNGAYNRCQDMMQFYFLIVKAKSNTTEQIALSFIVNSMICVIKKLASNGNVYGLYSGRLHVESRFCFESKHMPRCYFSHSTYASLAVVSNSCTSHPTVRGYASLVQVADSVVK
jgi:hypothetical protein